MKAATLSSTLLARKGSAAPSYLRPVILPATPPGERPAADSRPAASPRLDLVPPPRGRRGRSEEEAQAGPTRVSMPHRDRHGRIKLSLRLDLDRYAQLRLVAVHTNRHLQDILVDALDRYIDEVAPRVAAAGCTCFPSPADGDEP